MEPIVLGVISALVVASVVASVTSVWISTAKAPPTSNDELVRKVGQLELALEDVFDQIERWSKRAAVRNTRAKKAAAEDVSTDDPTPETQPADPAVFSRPGILRGLGDRGLHR